HYSGKAQREKAVYEQAQRDKEMAAAREFGATAGDDTGETPALTVEAPPPPTEEEFFTLESDKVVFTFTNIGGGIKHAEFKDEFEVGSKTIRVRKNRFGRGPIGTLAGRGEALENELYSFNKEESI